MIKQLLDKAEAGLIKRSSEWARRAAALIEQNNNPDTINKLRPPSNYYNSFELHNELHSRIRDLDNAASKRLDPRYDLFENGEARAALRKLPGWSLKGYTALRDTFIPQSRLDVIKNDNIRRGFKHGGIGFAADPFETLARKTTLKPLLDDNTTPLVTNPKNYAYKGMPDYKSIVNTYSTATVSPDTPLWWSGLPTVSHGYAIGGPGKETGPNAMMARMEAVNEPKYPSFDESGAAMRTPGKWRYTPHISDPSPTGEIPVGDSSKLRITAPGFSDGAKGSFDEHPYYEMVTHNIEQPNKIQLFGDLQENNGVITGRRAREFVKQDIDPHTFSKNVEPYRTIPELRQRTSYRPEVPEEGLFGIPVTTGKFYPRGPSRQYDPASVAIRNAAIARNAGAARHASARTVSNVVDNVKDFTNQAVANPGATLRQHAPTVKRVAGNIAQAGKAGLAEGALTSGLNYVSGINPDDKGQNGYWRGVGNRVGAMTNAATAGGVVGGAATGGVGAPIGALTGAATQGVKNIFDAVVEGVGAIKDTWNTRPQALANQANANRGAAFKGTYTPNR